MRSKQDIIPEFGSPSKTLISFAGELLKPPALILDLGCGFGRNAVALAARGASVVCFDRDRKRLLRLMKFAPMQLAKSRDAKPHLGTLYPVCADVAHWPFPMNCFSAVVCVHLVANGILESCRYSLKRNGFFYVETFGNHGENYLDLPIAGQFRNQIADDFDFLLYCEKKLDPPKPMPCQSPLWVEKLSDPK